jgi:hypothetical protein
MFVCALLLTSCSSLLPWHDEPVSDEVNLAFTIQNNLLFLPTATINGHRGRYFFGSAERRSVIDPRVVQTVGAQPFALQLGSRETIRFSPVPLDLGKVGDAIIGADVWDQHAVTIDYRAGLLTYQKERVQPAYMRMFHYDAEPAIEVSVDGRPIVAVVDTALPDTLVLPRATEGRGNARVIVAGSDFGNIDVKYANVPLARIGNRLLSKFLVSIDYGKQNVGLWRDPRIP